MGSPAKNIEIKARARHWASQITRAGALSDTPAEILKQKDTFFSTDMGRLKMRERPPFPAELISYDRPDGKRPKPSKYRILRMEDAEPLKSMLAETIGIRGQVVKIRTLFRNGPARIHFDDVAHLGFFIELEVVLEDGESVDEGRRKAEQLMGELHIHQDDLLAGAYVDLLDDVKPPSGSGS